MYNGFRNWETWNMNQWIQNSENIYKRWRALLDSLGERELTAERAAVIGMMLLPQGYFEGDVVAQLLDVDWTELAATWSEELEG